MKDFQILARRSGKTELARQAMEFALDTGKTVVKLGPDGYAERFKRRGHLTRRELIGSQPNAQNSSQEVE